MKKNIVIVGGGIIGLCSAYYLQKAGHQVTIIDKSDMIDGASYVNAGFLTPSHIIPLAAPGVISKGLRYMFNPTSPFYMKPRLDRDFIKWLWYFKKSATRLNVERAMPLIKDISILSRELFKEIKDSGDLGDFHLERKGLLMLYQSEKESKHELQVAEKARVLGLEVNLLDSKGIEKIEPNVKIKAKGAIHYECDGHTTPTEFMSKMKAYLLEKGARIFKGEEVLDFKIKSRKIKTIKTDSASHSVDEVVFSAGSWTSDLSRKLDISVPMQAGKGYCIDVLEPTGIQMPAILMEAKVAVTPMKDMTRFAGTMEFSGINTSIKKERVGAIAKSVGQFYEGLKIAQKDIDEAKSGLRPVTPDGLPFIGKSKKISNLTIATGHAMMGWSLGPATGKLVAEVVSNQRTTIELASFSPDRKF